MTETRDEDENATVRRVARCIFPPHVFSQRAASRSRASASTSRRHCNARNRPSMVLTASRDSISGSCWAFRAARQSNAKLLGGAVGRSNPTPDPNPSSSAFSFPGDRGAGRALNGGGSKASGARRTLGAANASSFAARAPPIPRAFFSSRYFSSSSSASSSPSTWTCPRFSSRERTDPRRRATRGNRQPRDAPPSSPNVRESTRPRAKKRRDRTRRRRRRRRRDSRGESVGARLGMRWRRRPRTSRDRAAYGVDASSKTSPAPSSSFGGRGSSPRKIRSPPPLSPPRALFSPSSIRVQSRRGTRRRRPRRRRPPPRRRAPSPPA